MAEFAVSLSPDQRYFIQKLSSDDVANLINEVFFPADMGYTFIFRYLKLFWCDIPQDNSTLGASIDCTKDNLFTTLIFTAAIAFLAAANGYREYKRLKRKQNNDSYQYMYGQLSQENAANAHLNIDADLDIAEGIDEKDREQKKQDAWVSKYLSELLTQDEELKKKYKSIKMRNGELVFDFEEQKSANGTKFPVPWYARPFNWFQNSWINKKLITPAYIALGLSSFAYWIMWIGIGIYTGVFDVGIGGTSSGIAFGLPFGIGLLYPLFKIVHYFTNGNASKNQVTANIEGVTAEQQAQAKKNATIVLRQVMVRRRYEFNKARLTLLANQLNLDLTVQNAVLQKKLKGVAQRSETLDKEMSYIDEDYGTKVRTSFVSETMSAYVGVQYIAWIVTDFLSKVAKVTTNVPIVNVIMGAVLIGISVLRGLHKATTGHYERLKTANQARELLARRQLESSNNLEALYKEKLTSIGELKKQLGPSKKCAELEKLQIQLLDIDHPHFFGDKNRANTTREYRIKKGFARALTFINSFTTGAFVARIFFVKGTAIYLPFAAAALSNPLTVGIVLGAGFLYGLFKLYEYQLKRREELAKDTLEKHAEKIRCLRQQIELADLTLNILKKQENPDYSIAAEPDSAELTAGQGRTLDSDPEQSPLSASPVSASPVAASRNAGMEGRPVMGAGGVDDVSPVTLSRDFVFASPLAPPKNADRFSTSALIPTFSDEPAPSERLVVM